MQTAFFLGLIAVTLEAAENTVIGRWQTGGQDGIDAFFANHRCNCWCEHLDIEYERPSYSYAAIPRRQSTSYHSLLRG